VRANGTNSQSINPGFLGLNLLLLLSYVIHEPIATSWLNYLHISSMWTVAAYVAFWREYQMRHSFAAELYEFGPMMSRPMTQGRMTGPSELCIR